MMKTCDILVRYKHLNVTVEKWQNVDCWSFCVQRNEVKSSTFIEKSGNTC